MRIVCPACSAAYEVPDRELRVDRVVRCVRCGTDWAPVLAVPETEPALVPDVVEALAAPEVLPDSVAANPAPAPPKMALDEGVPIAKPVAPAGAPRRTLLPMLAIAWVLSVGAVIGGLAMLGVQRDRVMSAWPPSIRAYAALGLVARR